MATVHTTLNSVRGTSLGAVTPVAGSIELSAETLTSSSTSGVGTLTAPSLGTVWTVTPADGNVWVKFGTGTPVAASGTGHLCLAGQSRDFATTIVGEKIAIKDA